ncbi:MAG: hypothetical protein WEB88_05105 [Gemmatimonadota bacterium]
MTGAPGTRCAPLAGLAAALILLALSRWIRGHPAVPPDPPVVAAEALALVLLLVVHARSRPGGSQRVWFMLFSSRLRR